ncbi:hypothetical protein RND81_03G184800 [Saponaria officinalis]|uniref:WW domain-containing protein n=1 Tax=Saponaria officinalis TaxID=3572 RepID=A0AAW1M842_SAPOF
MVSFQTPFLELNTQSKTILDSDTNSKKRKWDDVDTGAAEVLVPFKGWLNSKTGSTPAKATKPFSDIELHLESPLPSEWQRCLDIQSGEIHFYNTRTQKRTVRDPRESTEPSSPRDSYMSLDLELNLPCGTLHHNFSTKSSEEETLTMMKKPCSSLPSRASTDLFKNLSSKIEKKSSSDNTNDDQAAEMVATACMRCHMLVMLQKSSPTCPNCKFVHPPYQTPPDLFKPRLSLSC